MTAEIEDFAHRVHDLMDKWDCLIEQLQKASRHAGPEGKKPYAETIEQLIALREGARRGLLQVDELENPACDVKAAWN